MKKKIKYIDFIDSNDKSFCIQRQQIDAPGEISLYQMPVWELTCILDAGGYSTMGDEPEFFMAGEVLLFAPDTPHGWSFHNPDFRTDGKSDTITILIPPGLLDKCIFSFPEIKTCIARMKDLRKAYKFDSQASEAVSAKMRSMLSMNDIEQLSALIDLFGMIAEHAEAIGTSVLARNYSKNISKLNDIARFMVNNFHRKISLDDVAKHVGMNRSSFCTFYKKETGHTFFSGLNEYRINCSCLMLIETTMPVSDICFAVGFDDIPYYNRTFKKLKGENPTIYRKRHLQTV